MTATPELTIDLRKLVLQVEDDLRKRLDQDEGNFGRWTNEHKAALEAGRTSAAWIAWRDDRITQSAVAWILTAVFIRFAEDNELVRPVWISGPAGRRQEALDAQITFFRAHPELTDREWLLEPIKYLKSLKATKGLVDEHSALWQVQPSGQMATSILEFWRSVNDAGDPVYDLHDPKLSTRFLGDLYQDLSEYAKKTYALLQTPEFVEEFILDQTLTPALTERPLEGLKLIDPTCGSGHFLLGAFARLNDVWAAREPGLDRRTRVNKALDAVHGVDLNAFAVAIARFRLTVAALQACEETSLELAPDFTFHLAAGDSLLHGQMQGEFRFEEFDADSKVSGFTYATEDLEQLKDILQPDKYDVVVGNPPYIKSPATSPNQQYRNLYKSINGQLTLTVPFMERFFGLATQGSAAQPAGWTGQITSNAFMKREFGSKIIEDFLSQQDLRLVADTSGAYIPGHGTPTVIIVGRHQAPTLSPVRAVLGVRGEPGRPEDPAHGLVWSAIIENVGNPSYDSEWITVTDLPRESLDTHPWSLSGGGASELLAHLKRESTSVLASRAADIGFMTVTREDDAYLIGAGTLRRQRISDQLIRSIAGGTAVRDWSAAATDSALCPYDSDGRPAIDEFSIRLLWAFKQHLLNRRALSGTQLEQGLEWWEYSQLNRRRYLASLLISFAFVSTHNHFVLDRGDTLYIRSAPVIKLPEGATEDEHLALLGILNSSTACFWLKQNSYPKGGDPVGDDGARVSQQPWSDRYEFTGTTLKDFPLPKTLPLDRGTALDVLAQRQADHSSKSVANDGTPTAERLGDARKQYESLRRQMIAQQEELDWQTYRLYGLINEDLTYSGGTPPEVALGERAFEIVLACSVEAGETDTAWFDRHSSSPATETPAHWPADYRELIQRRRDLIESKPSINLLERPEYKRRWSSEPWEKQQERALRGWLLDRLENQHLWFDRQGRPTARSISQLADLVSRDEDFLSVLSLWAGRKDVDVVKALTVLLTDEAVPYLAAQRLKEPGLRTYEAWQQTWDLQRREDADEDVGIIPVPPKYKSSDFRKPSWWRVRGKLDVPKERFILYPDAERSTDQTLVLGWAGWNRVEQFLALAAIMDQLVEDGADDGKLVPLVAGMGEILPWVVQWHGDIDPAYGVSMADFCTQQFHARAAQIDRSQDQLAAWRPNTPTRGRMAGAAS